MTHPPHHSPAIGPLPIAWPAGSKPLLLAILIAAAVGVCFSHGPSGSVFGMLTAVAAAIYAWVHRARLAGRQGRFLQGLAALALFSQIVDPGLLNTALVWFLIAAAALRIHGDTFSDLGSMVFRSTWLGLSAIPALLDDALRFRSSDQGRAAIGLLRFDLILLPLLATTTLTLLLIWANPLISAFADNVSLAWLAEFMREKGTIAAMVAFLLTRPLLKVWQGILGITLPSVDQAAPAWHARHFAPAPLVLSLLLLNALLGVQNLLDLLFMWSGKVLPDNMTYAEYAHRGAYPLIATALLAGAFVIVAMWPGAAIGRIWQIRVLVYVWIAQNIFLVTSTADRTLAYVEVYGMSELRLAALIWMGLVAWGLILIGWKIAQHRSNQWLVNVNVISAATLLVASSCADHKAYVANWNVEVAVSRLGTIAPFDWQYLQQLGLPALPAMRRLERAIGAMPPGTIASERLFLWPRLKQEMRVLETILQDRQSDWRRWTLRNSWIRPAP